MHKKNECIMTILKLYSPDVSIKSDTEFTRFWSEGKKESTQSSRRRIGKNWPGS